MPPAYETTNRRQCDVPGCGAPIKSGMLMCAACWRSAPLPARRAVNRTWADYRRAARLPLAPGGRIDQAKLKLLGRRRDDYYAAREVAIAAVERARP